MKRKLRKDEFLEGLEGGALWSNVEEIFFIRGDGWRVLSFA